MIVGSRFNGPPTSGNGGWVAGGLAAASGLPTNGPVRVTLVGPPPLDVDLDVVVTGSGAELRHGDVVLARAEPAAAIGDPVDAVDVDTAAAGRAHFLEFDRHPFPTCFVCGTARPDGLRVFPGPVTAGDWTLVATTFATTEFAGAAELLWGVLDCPTGWAAGLTDHPALLASYTVLVTDRAAAGEPCVLVGADDGVRGTSGRAHASRSAAYGADGRLLGRADAVWIAPKTPPAGLAGSPA